VKAIIEEDIFVDYFIDVISLSGTGLERFDIMPPKLIVGLSITHPLEVFSASHLVFPAVLDTGLNGSLEIHEKHLHYWNTTPQQKFTTVGTTHNATSNHPAYQYIMARVWLHRERYSSPRFIKSGKSPILLMETDQIEVTTTPSSDPRPRLPLLGIQTLIQNHLTLHVDGLTSSFTI
jgi:hypothetical protein